MTEALFDEPSAVPVHEWVLAAVTGIRDAIVVVDHEGKLVYLNPAARKLVDVVGRRALPSAEALLLRAIAGEEVRDVSVFVQSERTPSGLYMLCSASPLRDAAGKVRGAVGSFHDMTVAHRHEEQLREGERQKKAILDNLPDIAWLKDEQSRFVLVNQALAVAAGRERAEELVGLTDLELWPRELAEAYRADDLEVMRTRVHKSVEEPFVDAQGRRSWVETFKTCILDDRGRVIGTTGIARDITERKRGEEELRAAKELLEQRVHERTAELAVAQENLVRRERLAVLGQLSGGVAHQIRNPLAAIMNASYVLKRHLSPDKHEDVADAIRIIHDEVRHANNIITSLLDYARVRSPDRHPVSLTELLDRLLDSDWIPPNVAVERTVPHGDSVTSNVDADQVEDALANVIRNAVDAMPDGGKLSVGLSLSADEVIFTITDTGPGISPNVREHLFEPLHSTKPMGIGLGLVTAKHFVEAHGGRIECRHVPRGACFEIRLPLH